MKFLDPNGLFGASGEYTHGSLTVQGTPDNFPLDIARIVDANTNMDILRNWTKRDHPAHLNPNRSFAAAGTFGDTRVQFGSNKLADSLKYFAKKDEDSAADAYGEGLHALQDVFNHGNKTHNEHS